MEGVLGFQHGSDRGTGDLFQSPFASVVIDDGHLVRAVQYVSLHPVRAKPVKGPEEWKWSSVRAHLAEVDDTVLKVRPVLVRVPTSHDLMFARFIDVISTEHRGFCDA